MHKAMGAKLDTTRTVETPEGVELTLRAAGPLLRCIAWGIDFAIRAVFYVLASFLLVLGDLGEGLLFILVWAVEWFYPVLFEVLWYGRTPGKAAVDLVVLNDDGTPVGWTASIIRNFLRFADFLPFFYLLGLVSMMLHRDFKRLGDIAAGTIVVYRDRPPVAARLPAAEAVPIPVALDLEEQRAVIDYAERSVGFSQDRNEELAEIVEPLVGGPPAAGVQRLRGMALWLMGQR